MIPDLNQHSNNQKQLLVDFVGDVSRIKINKI